MTSFADLLHEGAGHAWLFLPTAVLLGALHGLEPGHSKTMMAAFIIAVRGTVAQAALLGLSAALSHSAVVWLVAIGGQYIGREYAAETVEPYLQLGSAVLIAGVAVWMMWRTHRDHDRHHHDHHHDHAEPAQDDEPMDAHARAHADDIERRFRGRDVTTSQILMFGLTGGLIPCPAAITVLLLCLQLKQLALGVTLVAGFSLGLALTMVSAGVVAALGMQQAQKRWAGFGDLMSRAPYASGALMLLVAAYVGVSGMMGLAAHAA